MNPSLRKRRRSVVALLLAGLATSACVEQPEPGLTMSALEQQLVFGVEVEEESAPVPAQAAVRPAPPAIPRPRLTIPTQDDGGFVLEPPPPPLCAKSEEIAVEFEALGNVPKGLRPKEGVYNWLVQTGVSRIGPDGNSVVVLELQGFEKRAIRNVRDLPPAEWTANPTQGLDREVFTYEEVRPLGLRRTATSAGSADVELYLVSTYLVDTDALTAATTATGAVFQTPKGGDPERGVALVKTQVVDPDGKPAAGFRAFTPSNGLLLLPLPVSSAEEYQSAAVDPASGMSIVQDRTTVGVRERIDACGKLMEGWEVTAFQVVAESRPQDPDPRQFRYQTYVAPQHGGVIIYEQVENTVSGEVADYMLAQFEPDPLPADGMPR